MRKTSAITAALLLGLSAVPAAAHVGHDAAFSLVAGLWHPLAGLDHLAAMVTVGLWAAVAGGGRIWVWPTAFLTMMVAGGALGMAGVPLPIVEPLIAASLVVLGLLTALAVKAPTAAGALLVATFAVVHGHAHGAEAPADALGFAAGVLVSTAALHAVGVALGLALPARFGQFPARALGTATAALGLVFLVQGAGA